MAERTECRICGKFVSITKAGKLRAHYADLYNSDSTYCDGSGRSALPSGPPNGVPFPAQRADPHEAPGLVTLIQRGELAFINGAWRPVETTPPVPEGPAPAPIFEPPVPVFAQPAPVRNAPRKRQALEGDALALAAHMKEVFWEAVHNQRRTQQTVIGPSEIGHECDRRIAYKLAGTAQCNHTQDGWAAWVGTQIHKGLEDIFRARDKGSGRYLVDLHVELPSTVVPGGTLDRADRVLGVILDDKALGESSLSKMWLDGPGMQYRTQLHTYAYGMDRKGERFGKVALIGWPRESGSLDNLYVHVEDYDPQIAERAIARVEALAARLAQGTLPGEMPATTGWLCKWCPYHLPDSIDLTWGCPGR